MSVLQVTTYDSDSTNNLPREYQPNKPMSKNLPIYLTSFMLRNRPETIIEGKGREHVFRLSGIITLVCIEARLKRGNDAERLDVIAQVIARGDGKPNKPRNLSPAAYDLKNARRGYSLPIHCILCCGLSFQFFKFERTPNPTLFRGCFPGDSAHLQRGLHLPDFIAESTLPFILISPSPSGQAKPSLI